MVIIFAKSFWKKYEKLQSPLQIKFNDRLELFEINKNNPILKNHRLHGKLSDHFSINVTGEIRALYTEEKGVVTFVTIGSHSELY